MEATKDYGDEPVRNDLGALLLLIAACPFGLLMWAALFSALQWLIVFVWGAAVSFAANTTTVQAHSERAFPAYYADPSMAAPDPAATASR